MSELQLDTLLEATLFGAGRSMSVTELCDSLGYDEDEMLDCLYSLRSTLKRRRGGALQIAEVGDRWAKAASLIAYHQPMSQSRLVELLGQKAYDYVRELAQYGMIDRRKDGNTRRLTTTRRFSEAFGCPYTDRKKVKAWFREQVQKTGILDSLETNDVLKDETEYQGTVQDTLKFAEE